MGYNSASAVQLFMYAVPVAVPKNEIARLFDFLVEYEVMFVTENVQVGPALISTGNIQFAYALAPTGPPLST